MQQLQQQHRWYLTKANSPHGLKHNRTIEAIYKHIMSLYTVHLSQCSIRVDKSANSRIIISTLQVVHPEFGIVIVPAVTEGIILCINIGSDTADWRSRAVAPCIVSIGTNLLSAVISLHSSDTPTPTSIKRGKFERKYSQHKEYTSD